ncbi:MAG: GspE/PulE family protein [Kiritimatiellia bacterium]
MTSNDEYVLQILLENQVVSKADVDQAALKVADKGMSVVDILIQSGRLSEEQVLGTLAQTFGMEFVDISQVELSEDLRKVLPGELAKKFKVVPLYVSGNTLTVAMADPMNFETLDGLRYALGRDVDGVIAPYKQILTSLVMLYPEQETSDIDALFDELAASEAEQAADAEDAGLESQLGAAEASEADAPIVKLCAQIIMKAFLSRASDIHLEPMGNRFRIRYRIDGVLHEQEPPPRRLQGAILQRFKLMANMKLSEKRIPQDGRIQVRVKSRELDLRVSTVPTGHGESIVMRILDKQNLALGLPELGFMTDDQQFFEQLITLPDGVILVTGPTGSGKTTTLYACLGQINKPDRKIITVEDPVEYQMTGINQVHVHSDIGMTFAAALRAILRQAPNIVMIGEIRDLETASIATEAALTGHLVFSTLHTNDAPSAITRLLDIGVKPFLVASALRAVMAQRLVRSICTECRMSYEPAELELRSLGLNPAEHANVELYRGHGCPRCRQGGYKGRKGIFEIFKVDDEIQRMIFNNKGARDLRIRAREMGMRTLREDGIRKALAGITTVEEVLRVTMGDED